MSQTVRSVTASIRPRLMSRGDAMDDSYCQQRGRASIRPRLMSRGDRHCWNTCSDNGMGRVPRAVAIYGVGRPERCGHGSLKSLSGLEVAARERLRAATPMECPVLSKTYGAKPARGRVQHQRPRGASHECADWGQVRGFAHQDPLALVNGRYAKTSECVGVERLGLELRQTEDRRHAVRCQAGSP